MKKQRTFEFNYNGRDLCFKDDSDLYDNFLLQFDYDSVNYDDKYIYIELADGNEIKIKLKDATYNVGDRVFFISDNGELSASAGIIINAENNLYSIIKLTSSKNGTVYHNVKSSNIENINNKDRIIDLINKHFDEKILQQKSLLKTVTQEDKDIEKTTKYRKLQEQIKATAKHLYEATEDIDFENKLNAICLLKKQLYTIELNCASDIRKQNGHILYNIKKLEEKRKRELNNISDNIKYIL